MIEHSSEDPAGDDSYVNGLAAWDDAFAREPRQSGPEARQEAPLPAWPTLDLLRRLAGLRGLRAASPVRALASDVTGAGTAIQPASRGELPSASREISNEPTAL